MRSTKTDRRILWGWVKSNGTVAGGNCAFGVTRTGAGAYTINVTEPSGLPVPCSVHLTPIASVASATYAEHSAFPSQRALGVQTRTAGALADNDFYWTAVGA